MTKFLNLRILNAGGIFKNVPYHINAIILIYIKREELIVNIRLLILHERNIFFAKIEENFKANILAKIQFLIEGTLKHQKISNLVINS